MKKIEVVRVGAKDVYRAFIPCRGKMDRIGAKKYIEDTGLKVKKILDIEIAESRYGNYVYYKGGR